MAAVRPPLETPSLTSTLSYFHPPRTHCSRRSRGRRTVVAAVRATPRDPLSYFHPSRPPPLLPPLETPSLTSTHLAHIVVVRVEIDAQLGQQSGPPLETPSLTSTPRDPPPLLPPSLTSTHLAHIVVVGVEIDAQLGQQSGPPLETPSLTSTPRDPLPYFHPSRPPLLLPPSLTSTHLAHIVVVGVEIDTQLGQQSGPPLETPLPYFHPSRPPLLLPPTSHTL